MSDFKLWGRRRAPSDMIYEMLDLLKDGRSWLKTRIMGKLGINWGTLNMILETLDNNGMVVLEKIPRGQRFMYPVTITNDGMQLYRELGMLRRLRDD